MNTVRSKDNTVIAYERLGEGEPVVLIDGALCSRSFGPMPKLAPLLAQQFTVIMYDRRGRGDSGDAGSYSPEREVEDIATLVREAGGSAALFGISSGAALALQAVASGVPVSKLAMYEPPFVAQSNNQGRLAGSEAHLRNLIAADRRGDAVKFFMTKMVGAPAIFAFLMQLTPAWKRLKAVAHTLPYDAAIMGDFSLPAASISCVTIPALIAGGEKSPGPLRSAVHKVAEALPNGTLRLLQGQTHNINVDVLAPLVADFLTPGGKRAEPQRQMAV